MECHQGHVGKLEGETYFCARKITNKISKYQFIVDEKNRLGSEEEFWNKYHNDKGRLSYQDILDALQIARSETATATANNARRFFQDSMNSETAQRIFTYVKNGVSRPCLRDATIAQRWQTLLASNSEIQREWEEMKETGEITMLKNTHSEHIEVAMQPVMVLKLVS